jgi:hypothetical protein
MQDYFGEACLLKSEERTASVRSLSFCDCFVLSKVVGMQNVSTLEDERVVPTNLTPPPSLSNKAKFDSVLANYSPECLDRY